MDGTTTATATATGASTTTPETCVVICHWTGRSRHNLNRLLRRMGRFEAGAPFDLLIVCNGGGLERADLPIVPQGVNLRILNRANQGYNIGAWDAGFKACPAYRYYLFLQDECLPKKAGWLEAFLFRQKNDPGIGLLGEALMWDGLTWDYVKLATARDLGPDWFAPAPVNPIDFYRQRLSEMGIPEGDIASHLQSLILFAEGALLHQMGGLPSDDSYQGAVACEIAISRKVVALGYRIGLVEPGKAFSMIGHPQWSWAGQQALRLGRLKAGLLRSLRLR